jgi:hypothetical protein
MCSYSIASGIFALETEVGKGHQSDYAMGELTCSEGGHDYLMTII